MDHKGLADFNKYTLFLSGAGFIYTLEKYALADPSWQAVVALGSFFVAFVAGVLVFWFTTAAMHSEQKAEKNKGKIAKSGTMHAAVLIVAAGFLGWLVICDVCSAFADFEQVRPFGGWT